MSSMRDPYRQPRAATQGANLMGKMSPQKQPPTYVRAAYKGIADEFRLYEPLKPGEKPFVRLPNGKRATVTQRRDGSYLVDE
jgi:hypothetical protein